MGGGTLIGAPLKFPAREDLGHGVFARWPWPADSGNSVGASATRTRPFSGLTGWERGDGEHETDRQTQVGVFSSALDLDIGAPGPPDLLQKPEMRIGKQNTLCR